MAVEATVPAPIQTEAVIPPAVAAEVPAVLLGTETPAVTADPAATPEALAAKAATDAQAAIDATAAADAKTAADALAAKGAPDKYEFKAPEGLTYDSNLLAAFDASAKTANLPQDAAQKLLDELSPKLAASQVEQAAAFRKSWFDASQADKDFGGANIDANLGIAKKALDAFGTPELSALLVSTGLGNHPELIRLLFKAGKALSEDSFVSGAASPASAAKASTILYDNPSSKG